MYASSWVRAIMSLPLGEAELMDTAVHRVHGVKHVADVASLRGSGINGNKGSLTQVSHCISSLPFGEAELMETKPWKLQAKASSNTSLPFGEAELIDLLPKC